MSNNKATVRTIKNQLQQMEAVVIGYSAGVLKKSNFSAHRKIGFNCVGDVRYYLTNRAGSARIEVDRIDSTSGNDEMHRGGCRKRLGCGLRDAITRSYLFIFVSVHLVIHPGRYC